MSWLSMPYPRARRAPRLRVISLSVATLACAATAHAGEPVPSEQVRLNLFSTCFADDRVGWAVGDLGRIFRTEDGTKTWRIQNAGTKSPFVSVSCVGSERAWIAGQVGRMARTRDAGATWDTLETGVESKLLSVRFVDESRGVVVGDQGTLLTTSNGGDSWTAVEVPPDTPMPEEYIGIVEPSDVVLYDAAWASADKVVVVGEFGVILVSEDGGRSFEARPSGIETTLFGVFFADPQRGWAVGMESLLLATEDGGETWRPLRVQSPPGFSLSLYDLEVRGNLGWAVGNSGFLLTSTDAGRSWQLVDVPPQLGSYWLREVSLLPSGKGFAVGNNGIVLALDGVEWTPNKDEL